MGLLPLVLLELGLRSFGEHLTASPTPTIQFAAERPLFVLDEEVGEYVIPPSRQPFFKRDSFAADKDSRGFRIFCLGGSTVQGNPYSIETSFTTWLELSLRAADPRRHWEVVNCGGISYASYRLSPILKECLQYNPDLFILYLGDNEFLEERNYPRVAMSRQLAWLEHLKLFQAGRNLYRGKLKQADAKTPPIQLAAEVDALLDYQGGLAQYHRDDEWREAVTNHFRIVLDQMVQEARGVGVPVLIVDPVCNLKDCAPFKVESDKSLNAQKKLRFQVLLERAEQSNSTEEKLEALDEALAIDPRHAGAWFLLGQAYLVANRDGEAWDAFVRAKDEDLCPLRMIEPMREIIYACAQSKGVPVIGAMGLFQDKSPHGIPGDELMLDHVHPTITGHQMIADLIFDELARQGVVTPGENWKELQQEQYRDHLATLDTPYYARGQEHLDGLRKWAQGRVKKLRSGSK